MIFMPRIDLWAFETFNEADRKESHPDSTNPELSDEATFVKQSQAISRDTSQKTSHIWSLFVEQVESICVSTSLMILATSEVPFAVLPLRIRQFFKSEALGCSFPTLSEETIPRFSIHLDGNFNRDIVINSCAVELSKNITQQFVQLIHHRTHVCASSLMENRSDSLKADANKVPDNMNPGPVNEHERTQFPESSVMKVSRPPNCRSPKGKSGFLLAISTFGCQILRYPHFAELCWVTSKLKEGPCADINGPWKGWPFNSCIVRPSKSVEKVAVACSSSNITSKEKSGLVRGLVAVGLSAYRGVYTSLREVSFEVRKVLELLAGEINDKIQAGKDGYQFIRLLSQMSYLEDVVNSWAYTLQSFGVDAPMTLPTPKIINLGSLDNYKRCEDHISQSDGCEQDVSVKSSHVIEVLNRNPQRFDLNKRAGHVDRISEGRVVTEGPPRQTLLHPSAPDLHFPSSAAATVPLVGKLVNGQNGIHPQPCGAENPGNHSCVDRDLGSSRHSNGFAHSDSVILPGDDACCSGELGGIKSFYSREAHDQCNGLTMETSIPSEDGEPRSNVEHNLAVSVSSSRNTSSVSKDSGIVCFYGCCSECLFNLHNMMRKILVYEWGLKESGCTVEDVHDVVASLLVSLQTAVRKLCVSGNSSVLFDGKLRNDTVRKFFEDQETDDCQCKGSEDRSMVLMECRCHSRSNKVATSRANSSPNSRHRFDLKFTYRDGVLCPADPSENVSFHCKFRNLCLCSFIEFIAMTKQPSD